MLLLVRRRAFPFWKQLVELIRHAGYVADATQKIRGISPMHDSGTGSSLGMTRSYSSVPKRALTVFERNIWQL